MADGETSDRRPPQQVTSRRDQRAYLRQLKFEAQVELMSDTIAKLKEGKFTISDTGLLGDELFKSVGSGPSNTLTPHERFLDRWRVWITAGTLVALFAVVGLILFTGTAAAAATPYVSLVSGLAGIALGWMFASAGIPRGTSPPSSNDSQSQSSDPGQGA